MSRLEFQWWSTYATLELEIDSPIVEAVSAYWNYVKTAVVGWKVSGERTISQIINEEEVDLGVRLALLAEDPRRLGDLDSTLGCYNEVCLRILLCWGGGIIWAIKKPTLEMCLMAVRSNPDALRYVQNEYRTYEVCKAAVERDGLVLRLVPDVIRVDLALIAVTQEPDALAKCYEPAPAVVLTALQQYLLRCIPQVNPPHLRDTLTAMIDQMSAVIAALEPC